MLIPFLCSERLFFPSIAVKLVPAWALYWLLWGQGQEATKLKQPPEVELSRYPSLALRGWHYWPLNPFIYSRGIWELALCSTFCCPHGAPPWGQRLWLTNRWTPHVWELCRSITECRKKWHNELSMGKRPDLDQGRLSWGNGHSAQVGTCWPDKAESRRVGEVDLDMAPTCKGHPF